MSRLFRIVLPALVSILPCVCAAGGDVPAAGTFGFDEMKPRTTHCVALDAALIKRFKACTHSTQNSFGDDRAGYDCKIDSRSEFMVYQTFAECKTELELERANGD